MNVVCICCDTLRADIIGPGAALGHVGTPNFDAFAADAVMFDQAFGESQPTLQMRRNLFTGKRGFPWRWNFDRRGNWHHQPGWHKIPPEQDTIAEILLARGYATGLVADVYHMFKPTMNFTRGFAAYDFIRGQESDNWRSGPNELILDELKQRVREPINWPQHQTLVQYLHNMRDRQTEDDYLCAKVASSACRWLEDNQQNGPFFLWVDFFDPHEPWDPPKRLADKYCPGYDGPDFCFPGAMGPNPTELELERTKALYFGEVTFVDACFARIIEQLDRLKLTDDTIVVLLSDHGTELRDHGWWGKNPEHMHPYNTRLNLIVRHPDGPRGQRVDALVQSHDLAPTICHWLEVPYDRFDGVDFWPTVRGEKVHDQIVGAWTMSSESRAGGRVNVRDHRWSYVVTVHANEPGPELYDLVADPGEHVNVVDQHPEVAAEKCRAAEAVVGQPLPAMLEEVTTKQAPSPGIKLFQARKRLG